MSYNIDWQSGGDEGIPGKQDINLPQKTINTSSTTLALTGKGVANYGEIQQENFLRLMEHFTSKFPPANATIGQIWFNPEDIVLYMRIDPDAVGELHPRYYPESPAAWVQIWPDSISLASVAEYNALAITINRIIGNPSVYGTNPDVAENQYGWGQTDLVPEYDSLNFLKPGFPSSVFPVPLDNSSWAILLSRLRKALRHIDIDADLTNPLEDRPSPVGFINDGRPNLAGNFLANEYNDLDDPVQNPGGAGTLPNYGPGWGNYGLFGMQLLYAQTLSAVQHLRDNRFIRAAISTEIAQLNTVSRTNFTDEVAHSFTLQFTNETEAKAYFNSGGTVKFDFALTANGGSALDIAWTQFLTDISGQHFDYKGIHKAGVYHLVPAQTSSLGFYDLTGTPQIVYLQERHRPGSPTDATGDTVQITAHTATVSGNFRIIFTVRFAEKPSAFDTLYDGGINTVAGLLTSTQSAYKASPRNINSQAIPMPVVVASTGIV